jgi:hypothetical protein
MSKKENCPACGKKAPKDQELSSAEAMKLALRLNRPIRLVYADGKVRYLCVCLGCGCHFYDWLEVQKCPTCIKGKKPERYKGIW